MTPLSDVVIVSAFGRGQWLASELSRQHGFHVSLVDVSEQLGRWSAEDWEGPFGLFQSEHLSQTQLGRLSHEDYTDTNPQGLTLWLKNGPVDFMGPITQFWLDSSGPMHFLKEYLNAWELRRGKSYHRQLMSQILDESFEKTWMVHLAHQLASTVYTPNAHGVTWGAPIPMFAPWLTRRNTRKGYLKSLDWCSDKGVKVYSKAKWVDIKFEGKNWHSLEFQSEQMSGALTGKQMIWMLTSLETHYLRAQQSKELFPQGPLEPEWAWLRFRFDLDLKQYDSAVPGHFVIIKDNRLPWTHDNLLIALKVVTGGGFDIWARVPYHQRFQRSSLEQFSVEIETILSDRFPNGDPKVSAMPQEYQYAYDELGPSLFPVFSMNHLLKFQRKFYQNVLFGGPEVWERQDWTGRFQNDQQLLKSILDFQAALKKKETGSDTAIHPS